MAQKVYGPVRGAGVQLTELEGDKPIQRAALGYTAYAGILEKGNVRELLQCLDKTAFLKKCGSYIADSQVPDAAIDFFDGAVGAGGLYLVRVTDGNEVQSEITLYARNADLLTPMGTVKAKNGGRWGGKDAWYTDDAALIGDFDETEVTTGIATWTTDQWKGGYFEHPDVANKQYEIISNTAAGVITLAADSTLKTDIGAGTDLRYYLRLENAGKELTVLIGDGEENASTEFSLRVYVDGNLVKTYGNLSTDPLSSRYWVSIINDDTSNDEIFCVDLWTGAHVAAVRPATHYGIVEAITSTVLTAELSDFNVTVSPGGADATFALGTTTDEMVEQKITVTMNGVGTFDAVSDKFGVLGLGTDATDTLFTPNNKWTPPFTITEGGTALASGDIMVINYKPFVADELIGGHLYPDKPNASREFYRIVDNDHATITVADGSDLTTSGAIADEFMVVAARSLSGGIDGNADMADADYNQQAWDTSTSPFNQLRNKGLGLVKFANPGVTATAVQKAGVAYAAAKNHQFRYEVPAATLTEEAVDEYINDTIGRNDYAVVSFPSYSYVADPEGGGEGKLKLVTSTGQVHGAEALSAKNWDGYHKAAAGEDVKLPKILKLPTGDTILNEEYLNPLGINVIKKLKGNFVLWGDRTLWTDPNWKWKHQREQMSYYEQTLIESFGWIVFAINDPDTQVLALTSLQSLFLPEWQKGALRGSTFQDAAILKIDSENNTDLTRSDGDMWADIKLRLADTIERFRIRIGKQGLFTAAV